MVDSPIVYLVTLFQYSICVLCRGHSVTRSRQTTVHYLLTGVHSLCTSMPKMCFIAMCSLSNSSSLSLHAIGSQHGSGGEENMPAFLPGKYIAPEVPPSSDTAARGRGAGGRVTAPTRATHQYLAGTSPLVTPALTTKTTGAK